MGRLLYLDNLKVCLTALVIFHHAGQAYGDGGGWAYTPSNPAEVKPCSFASDCSGCSGSTATGIASSGSGVPPKLTEPILSIYY